MKLLGHSPPPHCIHYWPIENNGQQEADGQLCNNAPSWHTDCSEGWEGLHSADTLVTTQQRKQQFLAHGLLPH